MVSVWSRHGTPYGTPAGPSEALWSSAPTPADGGAQAHLGVGKRADRSAAPDDIGAPFVEAIASSFAGLRKNPGSPEPSAVVGEDLGPGESSIAREQSDAPAECVAPVETAAEVTEPERWPLRQSLARASSRVMARVRERPLRRDLRISLAAAGLCSTGFLMLQIVVERPADPGETATVDVTERATASVDRQDPAPAEAKNPEPAPAPAPFPPEPDPALASGENIPLTEDTAGEEAVAASRMAAGGARTEETSEETARSAGVEASPAHAPDCVQEAFHNHCPTPASDATAAQTAIGVAAVQDPPAAEQPGQGAKQAPAEDLDAAEARLKAALAQGKATKDKPLIAATSGELGAIFYKRGELDDAEAAFRQSLGLYEELSPADAALREGMARASNALGQIHRDRGQWDKAEKMYRKAAALDEALGRNVELAGDYNALAAVHQALKRYDMAEQAFLKALHIQKKLKSGEGIASSCGALGEFYFLRGDLERAAEMFRSAIAAGDAARLKRSVALDYSNLGIVYAKGRNDASACASWRKARRMMEDAGMKPELGRVQRAMRAHGCSQNGEAASLEQRLSRLLASSWRRATDEP